MSLDPTRHHPTLTHPRRKAGKFPLSVLRLGDERGSVSELRSNLP